MKRSVAAAARAVLGGDRGSSTEQIDHRATAPNIPAPPFTQTAIAPKPVAQRTRRPAGLRFWNGFGGFTGDGREYVIVIDGTSERRPSLPPAPWTNVLANPQFGCLVTEGGLGYTWAGNSQMNRLTPGRMIRLRTRQVKRSICATRKPVTSGHPLHCHWDRQQW